MTRKNKHAMLFTSALAVGILSFTSVQADTSAAPAPDTSLATEVAPQPSGGLIGHLMIPMSLEAMSDDITAGPADDDPVEPATGDKKVD